MPIWLRIAVTTAIALAFPGAAFAGTSAQASRFPTTSTRSSTLTQVDGPAREPAEAGLRHAPVRLRGRSPSRTARRLQHPAADLGPVLRPDRPLHRVELHHLPRRSRLPKSSGSIRRCGSRPRTRCTVESDEQLAQHSTYLLVVTRGVHDAGRRSARPTTFRRDLNFGQTKDPACKAYRKALLEHCVAAGGGPVRHRCPQPVHDADRSTRSPTKIRAQLMADARHVHTRHGGERTVFTTASVAAIQSTGRSGRARRSSTSFLPTPLFAGSSARSRSARTRHPTTRTRARSSRRSGRARARRCAQGDEPDRVQPLRPGRRPPRPAAGRSRSSATASPTRKTARPSQSPSSLAHDGIATIAINVVGHGGGPLGTYTVLRGRGAAGDVLPDGGRGIDQDGNGTIDSTEGVSAVGAHALIGNRDGLRQTVIDLMQLVRELKPGIDVDGDGSPDLETSRIYYAGQSFGGIYGDAAARPRAGHPRGRAERRRRPDHRDRAALPVVPAPRRHRAAHTDAVALQRRCRTRPSRTSTRTSRSATCRSSSTRSPARRRSRTLIDNTEWAQQSGEPGRRTRRCITQPVIFQFARGDQTVPNPTTAAILRAGGCADRATLFRNDLALAAIPALATNPHTFLTNVVGPRRAVRLRGAAADRDVLRERRRDDIDPDGAGPFFETPTSMVPEDLAFIP